MRAMFPASVTRKHPFSLGIMVETLVKNHDFLAKFIKGTKFCVVISLIVSLHVATIFLYL